MIDRNLYGRYWQWKIGGCIALAGVLSVGVGESVLAQITLDNTLGAEGSTITPNINIQGIPSDRIDGGATRGANLFHSFGDFNVGEGRGVYFANPTGIENILTRVTGNDPSNILGRLGVLGNGNLFLLNPNGIIFSPNASLDIQGSFVATTADRVQLGNSGYFSAVDPQTSSLLSVSPGALFFDRVANQPTTIINQGNLSTKKDLTLSAGNLDLQGQLLSGGELTLQAQDTVKVRDSAAIPFIASAGGNLLVQGNQKVDIFALTRLESGFFSGGDMVLRSINTVNGDARYWSGGSVRIEQLDGKLGDLYSPYDPIFRARGDVFINTYQGASLHILAGGKVEIPGYVWIQGADPENGLVETVNLADGTIISINGKSEPTLDIRAGVNPDVIGDQILTLIGSGNFFPPAYATSDQSSADIRIGTILFADVNSRPLAGRLLLTNQYQPNASLSGDIQVTQTLENGWGAIFMAGGAGIPAVALNSRGGITIDGIVNTSSDSSNGGAIRLEANGNITTQTLNASTNSDSAGDISLISRNGAINATGEINTYTEFFNAENGGRITLQSKGDITTLGMRSDGGNDGVSGDINITSDTGTIWVNGGEINSQNYGTLKGGDIKITATEGAIFLRNGTQLNANTAAQGDAGSINIFARDTVSFDRSTAFSRVENTATGNGGNINITTEGAIFLRNGTQLNANTAAQGDAGSINIFARDTVSFDRSAAFSSVENTATGNGGSINITTGSLSLNDGSALIVNTSGEGNGGTINVEAEQFFLSSNASLRGDVNPNAKGQGGNIDLDVTGLILLSGEITTPLPGYLWTGESTRITIGVLSGGIGSGGTLNIKAGALVLRDGAIVKNSTQGRGDAGNINVRADTVDISGSVPNTGLPSGLFTSTDTDGSAGNIAIDTRTFRITDGAALSARSKGDGQGGNIRVNATSFEATNGGQLVTTTFGQGQAGNIFVDATDKVTISGSDRNYTSRIAKFPNPIDPFVANAITETGANSGLFANTLTNSTGNGGNIEIVTSNFNLTDSAQISASTSGSGQGGNLFVTAPQAIAISSNGQLSVETSGAGAGGNLTIDTQQLTVQDGAQVSASTSSSNPNGGGGNILINSTQSLNLNQASLLAQSKGAAPAGNITINTRNLTNRDGRITTSSEQSTGGSIAIAASTINSFGSSKITTNVNSGAGGGGNIYLEADSVLAFDDSDILAFARDGRGGDITLNTPSFFGENYRTAPRNTNPDALDNNNRVDINASGAVSGVVVTPDVSFIQNSLIDLPENQLNTNSLLASSCIVRRNQATRGSFTITGTGGLPQRPGDSQMSSFPTVDVEALPGDRIASNRSWQKGDPIVEPQGLYRLPNGKLVLSRKCS